MGNNVQLQIIKLNIHPHDQSSQEVVIYFKDNSDYN